MISFFIAGKPKATQTGSIVRVGRRAIPLRRHEGWSALCGLIARQHAPAAPLEGPLVVRLTFLMPRPKKTKRAYPIVRPDAENLIKGMLDKFNGVLWQDDAQIVDLHVAKRYQQLDRVGTSGVHVEVDAVR